ncbi:ROK family protein [Streptomyces sp. NBC_01320]|uniref:ROK family protein n=1 Tax=Streptomyces sp. NBC_01320 TaxID=2903824 RepID=UPI003FA39E3E
MREPFAQRLRTRCPCSGCSGAGSTAAGSCASRGIRRLRRARTRGPPAGGAPLVPAVSGCVEHPCRPGGGVPVPVCRGYDADLAALSEAALCAAQAPETVVCLSIAPGFGAGIVLGTTVEVTVRDGVVDLGGQMVEADVPRLLAHQGHRRHDRSDRSREPCVRQRGPEAVLARPGMGEGSGCVACQAPAGRLPRPRSSRRTADAAVFAIRLNVPGSWGSSVTRGAVAGTRLVPGPYTVTAAGDP